MTETEDVSETETEDAWHWWQVLGLSTLLFMLTHSGLRCSCQLYSESVMHLDK